MMLRARLFAALVCCAAIPLGPVHAQAERPVRAAQQNALDLAVNAYRNKDFAEARVQAQRAADAGAAEGATLMALLQERGLGGPVNEAEAVRFYRIAAQQNEPDALIGLGRLGAARRGGATPAEALGALQRAIAANREDAAAPLADLLLSGAAGVRDPAAGSSLYQRAARGGDADAAYAAAILLNDADPSAPDDLPAARALLKQAADAGRADANADYGLMLYQGAGGPRDLPEAARRFRAAAEKGDLDGAFYWALVTARGEGAPRDLAEARRWAEKARGSSPDADRLHEALSRAPVAP
jgi:TPR repeat protein